MNNREKRDMIHRKLEVMRKCYQERNAENFDQFYDAFFDRNRLPIIIGTDNGCQTSMERFTSPQRKAFFGKCMVVATGNGSITAKSATLQPDVIEFTF